MEESHDDLVVDVWAVICAAVFAGIECGKTCPNTFFVGADERQAAFDAVFAVGEIPAERVANYVRARVLAGNVETGPAKTIFSRATVKSAPQRVIRIEVVSRAHVSELVVRDETRQPPERGLSVEERWRRNGLTPDGKVLDPTHLE